jgi:hypothetical protein
MSSENRATEFMAGLDAVGGEEAGLRSSSRPKVY